jgi:hypothetical protein
MNLPLANESLFEVLVSHSRGDSLSVLPELRAEESFHSSVISFLSVVIVSLENRPEFLILNLATESVHNSILCGTSE